MKPPAWLLLACALTVSAGARESQRDAAATPAAAVDDTASLSGVVVTADATPLPVRRAIVTITSPELPAPRGVVTGDEGQFTVERLPSGRFTVSVSKQSFVTSAYGATKPGRPGTPVALAVGQHRNDVRVTLVRGGVISGTIRGADGQPLSAIRVIVTPVGQAATASFFTAPEEVLTDDLGGFRAYGLAASEYLVLAIPKTRAYGRTEGPTDEQVDAQLRSLQAGRMTRPGVGGTQASPGGRGATAPTPVAGVNYTVVYYPGTPRLSQAAPVLVAAGQERAGIDFTLMPVPTVMVEGAITGQGPGGQMPSLMITGADGQSVPLGFSAAPTLASPRLGPDGRFQYSNVAPGRYTISARAALSTPAAPPIPTPPVPPVPGSGAPPARPQAGTPQSLWATATIDVGSTDITGLVLDLRPGLIVSGRVMFDGAADAVPRDLTGIRVAVSPPGPGGVSAMNMTVFGNPQRVATGFVAADTTFSILGVVPGTYLMTATLPSTPPSSYWLRSAVFEGRDLLDGPLDISDRADMSGIVLTFADRHNRIVGRLQSAAGTPAPDYFIVVFPSDPALRTSLRRVVSTRPATDGRYTVADLPAGEYQIAALTDVVPDEWRKPEFLEQLLTSSVHVLIPESGDTTQDLRLQ